MDLDQKWEKVEVEQKRLILDAKHLAALSRLDANQVKSLDSLLSQAITLGVEMGKLLERKTMFGELS